VARVNDALRYLLPPLLAVASILVFLQATLPLTGVPQFVLPLPSTVISRIMSPAIPWAAHSMVTLSEALGGFALAVAIGIPLAVATSLSRVFARIVEPLIVADQVAPKIAFVPILFLWLGLNPLPRILTVFLVCLFPIVIDTASGLASVELDMIDMVRSFNASKLALLEKVSLPTALPSIFSGLKISITLAMVGAVVAEFVSSSAGLGYLILSAQTQLDTALAFAAASLLILMAFLLYAAVLVLERLVVPWRR
jgi:NitT/TauT family transport system permease protein